MKSNSSTKLEKSYFDVLGLCCSSEVPLIEKILKPIEGVHEVSVIVPSRTVIVVHDPMLVSQLQIVKALNQARLEANVRVKGETSYRNKWPSPFAVACGVLLLLSFFSYVFSPFKWLALGAVAVGIIPIILKSFASLRNFRIDVNTLMLIAVGGSIFLKDYWEAGTIVFLFTTAEWLESRAGHKATAVMTSLMNMAPQKATLASNGEEVNANEVMVSTKLAVKAGDVIPIDGIVVQGRCEVDEKALTGESFPVSKQVDSTVWAGTINLNGYISIITTVLAEDCVVAKMAKLVEEAQNNKCKTQRYIDECAKYYTPAVIAIAASLAAIPAAMKLHNLDNWYHLALVVLVSSCPCALILSTPVATYCALSKAATTGLLIKGAEYLETLSKVKTFAFDKTGTITKGEFSVSNFHSLMDDISLDKLLYWVSSTESKSSHPMAAALIEYAQAHSVEAQPDDVEEFENFPGEGIYGKIEGKNVYVGNQKIATRAGCSTVLNSGSENMEGKSTGYIFLGSSLAGVFYLSDSCRTGAKEALKELKSMGIKTAMLTGDCQAAANQAQIQLEGSLDVIHSSLLPEDKAKIIKEFQNDAPTAMVGDGINDAPALATADIGISMGISGSALATETGQIILMSNDIRKIPIAVRLARKTRRKIFENIFLAIFTKAAIIGLAIAGHPLVWAAVLADVGTCLVVILNSMLLLRSAKKHSGSSHEHKHSHSSHKHVKCSSGKRDGGDCHKSKCSGVSQKQGCCGHDHKVHEQKNLVHEEESKQSCCAHDAHVHKMKHCAHDDHVHKTKHCAHDAHVHKTKHCAHDHEDVHVVKHLVLDIGSKHNCCAHDDDEVYKVKHEAHEHENHGCCAHDGDKVKQEAHKHENHGCCAHDGDEVNEVKHEANEHKNHGCCAHDGDEVNEVKHEAHEHKNHGCCAHDGNEVKQEAPKHKNHGCCAHDGDEVNEVKHEAHEHKNHGCCPDDGNEVKQEAPKHENHSCCAHDGDEVNEVKHEAHEHRNHGCCAHDGNEVKQEAPKHENHGCCAHDGDEVKHEAHEHKNHGCCAHDEDEVKLEAHKHENHGCCAHDGDEVKHEVHEHKNQGYCAHDDSQAEEEKLPVVEHIVQVKDKTRDCCDHANNETHKDGNMESQIKQSHSCEIDAKKKNDCCQEKISHKKSHSNHETHFSKDEHHHGNVKEYITEHELGKMVRHCCKNNGLEKRHVGACCKSYREKCCGHQHLGARFNGEGGLSEIVIE